jgi:hypothetical protein
MGSILDEVVESDVVAVRWSQLDAHLSVVGGRLAENQDDLRPRDKKFSLKNNRLDEPSRISGHCGGVPSGPVLPAERADVFGWRWSHGQTPPIFDGDGAAS